MVDPMTMVVFGLAMTLAAASSVPWEEVDDDDGIIVWARDVPGSDIREVKAEAVIDAPAKRVWDVLLDTGHYVEFIPYLESIRTVGTHARGTYEYEVVDPPIVDKRDYTVRIVLEPDEENGVYRRTWSPANDKGPKKQEDVVRLTINQGSWTVVAEGPKRARLTYYLYTDPGGSIPTWMANKANTSSLPELMTAMRNRSVNPKWRRDD